VTHTDQNGLFGPVRTCVTCHQRFHEPRRRGRPRRTCSEACARRVATQNRRRQRAGITHPDKVVYVNYRKGPDGPVRPYRKPGWDKSTPDRRHVRAQPENRLDFAHVVETPKTRWRSRERKRPEWEQLMRERTGDPWTRGPYEGRTGSAALKLIGSDRPWHEC
jgi:hypothetical protein